MNLHDSCGARIPRDWFVRSHRRQFDYDCLLLLSLSISHDVSIAGYDANRASNAFTNTKSGSGKQRAVENERNVDINKRYDTRREIYQIARLISSSHSPRVWRYTHNNYVHTLHARPIDTYDIPIYLIAHILRNWLTVSIRTDCENLSNCRNKCRNLFRTVM